MCAFFTVNLLQFMIEESEQLVENNFPNNGLQPNQDKVRPQNSVFQLTVGQAQTITSLLPKGYFLRVLSSKDKQKKSVGGYKNTKRRKKMQRQTSKAKISNNIYKKCLETLNKLKGSKFSWPFLQAVNPKLLGIPHYFSIIKRPMDLKKIEQKFTKYGYPNANVFFKDIELIINNSFVFNQDNPDFVKITTEFEKIYKSLRSKFSAQMLQEPINFPDLGQPQKQQMEKLSRRKQIKNSRRKLAHLRRQQFKMIAKQFNLNPDLKFANLEDLSQSALSQLAIILKAMETEKKIKLGISADQSDSDLSQLSEEEKH